MKQPATKLIKSPLFGISLAFVLLCIIIGMVEYFIKSHPVFFNPANILNILLQTSINTIIAVGMTYIIITAGIDLSVGSLLSLCNVLMGLAMLQFQSSAGFLQITSGILVALLIGSGVGLVNGFITVRWNVPPFIVTLGMLGVARGLALWSINSQTENLIGRISGTFDFIGNGQVLGVPFPAIVALLVVLIGHVLLHYTTFGRYIIAIGANEEAARLSGIATRRYKALAYVFGGFLVGLAAVIQTSRLGSANPTIGGGFELFAIAAVVIGGTSLMGGKGTVAGTLVGALIIGVLNNGLTLLNIPDEIKQIVIGLVIIFAVLLEKIQKRES